MLNHADFVRDALLLSLCSSIGQMLIYYTIKEFGALVYSTIMTTRQCLSVMLSALLFAHPITSSQWLGASTVFGALYWQVLDKKRRQSTQPTIPVHQK
jgi:adenosine 3'-phospho 5'-phosphosulfate transporter B2